MILCFMSRLAIPIPEWSLQRNVQVTVKKELSSARLVCQGVERGTQGGQIPASIIRQARAVAFGGKDNQRAVLTPDNRMTMLSSGLNQGFAVSLDFFGHYKEASFAFECPAEDTSFIISLWFHPKFENDWQFSVDSKAMTPISSAQFEERWG